MVNLRSRDVSELVERVAGKSAKASAIISIAFQKNSSLCGRFLQRIAEGFSASREVGEYPLPVVDLIVVGAGSL
jgi:enoyl-[acyl-carrier-protein] reductase (NADH)